MTRHPTSMKKLLLLTLTAYLGGCASQLSPQRYSEGLLTKPGSGEASGVCGSSASKSLKQALRCTEDLQRQYITAQRDLSEISPQLSNGLIAWTGLTLLSATVNPHAKDLAAMGILGSTAYAMGSRAPASARIKVFAAGVDALNCAVTAVAPLLPVAEHEGVRGKAGAGNLWGDLALAVEARNALQNTLTQLSDLNQPQELEAAKPAKVIKSNCGESRPVCTPLASANREDQAAFAAKCKRDAASWDRRCASKTLEPVPARTLLPHEQTQRSFEAADAQLLVSDARIKHAAGLAKALARAGNALWAQALEIQNAVGLEVQKTEPEPDKVFASIGNLGSVAYQLSSSELLKTSNAQSSRPAAKALGPGQTRSTQIPLELSKLNQQIDKARVHSDALQLWLLTGSTSDRTATIRKCKLGPLPVQVVTPQDTEGDPPQTETKTRTPYADYPKELLDALGLKPGDPDAKFMSRIKQCQRKEKPLDIITGVVEPGDATDQRLRNGECKGLKWDDPA